MFNSPNTSIQHHFHNHLHHHQVAIPAVGAFSSTSSSSPFALHFSSSLPHQFEEGAAVDGGGISAINGGAPSPLSLHRGQPQTHLNSLITPSSNTPTSSTYGASAALQLGAVPIPNGVAAVAVNGKMMSSGGGSPNGIGGGIAGVGGRPLQPLQQSYSSPLPPPPPSIHHNGGANGGNNIVATPVKNPRLYKTELCRSWAESGRCNYGDRCQYAHGDYDKRPVPRHPKYKTEACQSFHKTGYCPYGPRCHFVHNEEPRPRQSPANSTLSRQHSSSANIAGGNSQALISNPNMGNNGISAARYAPKVALDGSSPNKNHLTKRPPGLMLASSLPPFSMMGGSVDLSSIIGGDLNSPCHHNNNATYYLPHSPPSSQQQLQQQLPLHIHRHRAPTIPTAATAARALFSSASSNHSSIHPYSMSFDSHHHQHHSDRHSSLIGSGGMPPCTPPPLSSTSPPQQQQQRYGRGYCDGVNCAVVEVDSGTGSPTSTASTTPTRPSATASVVVDHTTTAATKRQLFSSTMLSTTGGAGDNGRVMELEEEYTFLASPSTPPISMPHSAHSLARKGEQQQFHAAFGFPGISPPGAGVMTVERQLATLCLTPPITTTAATTDYCNAHATELSYYYSHAATIDPTMMLVKMLGENEDDDDGARAINTHQASITTTTTTSPQSRRPSDSGSSSGSSNSASSFSSSSCCYNGGGGGDGSSSGCCDSDTAVPSAADAATTTRLPVFERLTTTTAPGTATTTPIDVMAMMGRGRNGSDC